MSRHRADFLSLAFGLLFVAIGLILLSGATGALSLAWVGPLTAIALGALLVTEDHQQRVRWRCDLIHGCLSWRAAVSLPMVSRGAS